MTSKSATVASTSTGKKRTTLTLGTKHEIIQLSDGGMKVAEIADKMNLARTTVRTIIKDKERLLLALSSSRPINSTIIRERHGLVADMESLLKMWCNDQVMVHNCPIDQKSICREAKVIFARLKELAGDEAKNETFLASHGWFYRFKQRCDWHNIGGTGKSASAHKDVLSFPKRLKKMIDEGGYCAKTIFSVHETGLFWKKMPRKTFIAQEEEVNPGYKATKDRLTLMLGGNAAGDCKLMPLLIYHLENPQALKNKSKSGLPVIWKSNSKARVTAGVFEDWFGHHFIPEVERYCHGQNLPFQVMLIIENAPGHPPATLLDFDPRVKVVFLPPKTKWLIQPMMDEGMIKTFKIFYIRRFFANLNAAMKENKDVTVKVFWKDFNILDALRIIADSWAEVSEKTMKSAWKKLCPFFFTEAQDSHVFPQVDTVSQAIEEVVNMATELDLEVDAGDVLEWLNSHDQQLTLVDLAEIKKQCALEEAEEADPEPKERTMTVSKLTEGLGLIEAGIKILQDIDSNEQRAATARQGIRKLIACYENILKEKKRSLSSQTSVRDFLKSSSKTRATQPLLLDYVVNDHNGPSTDHEEHPHPPPQPPPFSYCFGNYSQV